MASPLQNRIVGTAILVALAVIFLPDLLDGEKREREEALETIPLRPALTVEQSTAAFPEPIADTDETEADTPSPTADEEFMSVPEPVSVTLGSTESTSSEQVDGPAWVIRLGAFRNAESVERLVNELQAQGYTAYSRTVRSESGELRALFVGPDFDADRLRRQLGELKALTELEGQLVRYQPIPE